MKRNHGKRKLPQITVAIEVQRSKLVFVVAERQADGRTTLHGHLVPWMRQAESLHSGDGVRELTETLSMLVTSEKVAGAVAHVALSSELCVTRVVAGDHASLQTEVRNLRERSNQYLSLGAGDKAAAESSRAIDAKHSQTWLTVTKKSTLESVVQAVEHAGLSVELVEHSLVAMCRAVGQLGHDTDRPALTIDINERGVDLGVSYRGQLLFDYRPGGIDSKDHIGEIVARHLERIQRYCKREFRFATGSISEVFLCGEPDELESVRRQFARTTLQAEILDPQNVCPTWDFADSFRRNTHFVAPLGTLLVQPEQLQQPAQERGLPDLLDAYRDSRQGPLIPALLKSAWPIAASLLVAAGIYGAALVQHGWAGRIEQKQLAFDGQVQNVQHMQMETEMATKRIGFLTRINASVSNPAYHKLLAAIGQCRPRGVWLETLRIEQDGSVAIQGPGGTVDLVYGFVDQLKKVPTLQDVSLEGQQPIQLKRGPAIRFDIKCRYVDHTDPIERTARND